MADYYFLPYQQLQILIDLLYLDNYRCIGPQVRDDAIMYDDFSSIDQLPWGVRDFQGPGEYKLQPYDKTKAFSFANGPEAIKPQLFKSRESLWRVERDQNNQLKFEPVQQTEKLALFGIRPCDLHALSIQDKVFLESDFKDAHYQKRRENVFLIVVNCSYSSNNCFCLTAGGHPKAKRGYDIALAEIDDGFIAEFVSQKSLSLLSQLSLTRAKVSQLTTAENNIQKAVDMQTKKMPDVDMTELLMNNLDHPEWQKVAKRCLSCGNCTQVCPTCFCHRQVDQPALDGQTSEHYREWDSCFTEDHSYIHGLVIRSSTKQRYRQWLTHKLATWHEQFGTSGCVGCGRCITWCPVGIDITEEVSAINNNESSS